MLRVASITQVVLLDAGRERDKIRWCLTLTYNAEHDASKVMMGMEQSQTRHVCGTHRMRLDNFGMDFVPSTTLYVNPESVSSGRKMVEIRL